MRYFIKQIIYYFSLLLIFLLILISFTNSVILNNSDFKLDKDIKYIVLGHSHSECAFKDSIIYNFKNLSQSGESYFYTYQKIKELLNQNNQIETVFIEFSNNQIDKNMNEWIWGDKYMSNRYPKYAPFMDKKDNYVLIKNNFSSYINSVSVSLKKGITRIIKNDYSYSNKIGGYLYHKRNKIDSLLIARSKYFDNKENINFKFSTTNISYLEKIIELCMKYDKKIYLVRSPQHKYLQALNNEKYFLKIKDSLFPEISFLDFNDFKLINEEFGDFGHLNYKGAEKFSKEFNDLIVLDLLNNYKLD